MATERLLFFFYSFLCVSFFFFRASTNGHVNTSSSSPPSSQILFSPQFFHSNHALMLSAFKIFIYPSIHGDDFDASPYRFQPTASPQNVQDLFFSCLSQSRFVTQNGEAAHLYFIPASLDAIQRRKSGSLGRNMRDLVQNLRDEYPFWQRSLGVDHFFVVSSRFSGDGSRNVLELQKNAISVACWELFGHGEAERDGEEGMDLQFFPHKDIVMPPYNANEGIMVEQRQIEMESVKQRTRLVYVLNAKGEGKLWKQGMEETEEPWQEVRRSKFCVEILGKEKQSNDISLMEAMEEGCVPVIVVTEGRLQGLPFQNLLDWSKFSVIVSKRRLGELKEYLASIPEAKFRELQKNAMSAAIHFQWHLPPQPYDAFYMLMHQLWLARHSIRYASKRTTPFTVS